MAELWLRWYVGTSEDAKLRVVSKRSGGTVGNAIALWTAVLEDAAHPEHRGVAIRGADFYAVTLEIDPEIVTKMLTNMVTQTMLSVSERSGAFNVVHWNERQFETDFRDPTAALRRKRFKGVLPKRQRNGSETVTERKKRPDTDSDTDTESKKETRAMRANGHAVLDGDVAEAFDLFWEEYPEKVGKPAAKRAFPRALKSAGSIVVILEGLRRYKQRKPPDRSWLNPATFLNQERWNDRPAPAPVAPIGGGRGL